MNPPRKSLRNSFILLLALTTLLALIGTMKVSEKTVNSQPIPQETPTAVRGAQSEFAVKSDRTAKPLKTTKPRGTRGAITTREAEPVRLVRPNVTRGAAPSQPSSSSAPGIPTQTAKGSASTVEVKNFPTFGNGFSGVGLGLANSNSDLPAYRPEVAPPDTNGAAGGPIFDANGKKTSDGQYVQWVNSSFAVFDKSTGKLLYGPTEGRTLWEHFGTPCERNNDGDPIVQYDKMANRWILAQFAVNSEGGNGVPPYYQCIAVSDTSDALGTYKRYAFKYTDFNDFPKMAVWPDGYYTTFNMFQGESGPFLGAKLCVFDRRAMLGLENRPVSQQCIQRESRYGSFLPADADGSAQPLGEPNYLLALDVDSVSLWTFKVDWQTPANSQLYGPTYIKLGTFDVACNGRNCIPQKGTSQRLDSLADRLMYRLAFRKFTDHESLLFNHSVSMADGSTAIRWYELRNPGNSPTIFQGATFAPDANHRWMGSIAMDKAGNIGLAYSASGENLFPSIRFAGRDSADPLGKLQDEALIFDGKGSQQCVVNGQCVPQCKQRDGSCRALSRWGDYSSLSLDPDDCTMWYTTEYLEQSGAYNWNTRIAAIRFKSCKVQ